MTTRRYRPITALPIVALAAACGPAPEPAAPAPPPATVDVAPPPAPTASAVASAAAAQPPPAPSSPFGVVAELPAEAWLMATDGDALLVGDAFGDQGSAAAWLGKEGVAADKDGYLSGFPIGVFSRGTLRFPRKLVLEGGAGMRGFAAAVGRWPDDLWVLSTGTDGRTGIAEPWRVTEARGYEAKRGGSTGRFFVGAARQGATVVGMEAPSMPFPGTKPLLVDLATGKIAHAITPASKKDCWDAENKQLRQTVAVMPHGFGATKEGDLLSVGDTCGEAVGVEVWKAGAKASTVTTFAGAVEWGDRAAVVPAADKGAWITTADAVLRWDGAALSRVALPDSAGTPDALAVAPDGTTWVSTRKGLYRQTAGGWETVPLPDKGWVTSLGVADGALYATMGKRLLRLGARPGDPPVFTPSAAPVPSPISRTMAPPPPAPTVEATSAPRKPRFPGPGSAKCAHNVVLLYAFTKVTPDDYDFPLTRKAVKGHTELSGIEFAVVKENGKKFFSGLAPSFDAAKKLQALIAKEVKDSSPQIFCSEPEVVRKLAIDLRTGEVAKK